MEISFSVFLSDPQVAAASDNASVNNGSRPLGKAPACLETTKVSGPADTEPVEIVAHPTVRATTAKTKGIRICVCISVDAY